MRWRKVANDMHELRRPDGLVAGVITATRTPVYMFYTATAYRECGPVTMYGISTLEKAKAWVVAEIKWYNTVTTGARQ